MIRVLISVCVLVAIAAACPADHFDDHDREVIAGVEQSKAAQKVDAITLQQLSTIPHPIADRPASAFLIVKTRNGAWCKLLVRQARVKAGDEPTDIVLIERLVTYPDDPRRALEADRSEIYLFPGFAVNLDMGQVVPLGAGDDLRYLTDEPGPRLQSVGDAALFAVGRPMVPPSEAPKRRFGQGAIEAEEFGGEYRLEADGRWSGKATIEVDDGGVVSGTYVSDQSGQTYDISGRVGNPANRIAFKIEFPMTEQTFEGFLWSRQRGRISGVTHMLDRPFGFVMERTD